MCRMTNSAAVEPATSMALSKAHRAAVEKSVGIRMRRHGYIANDSLLGGLDGLRRDDVPDHRLRLSLGLRDLQGDVLVARFEGIAGDERVLHGVVEVHFERAPVLQGGVGR